MPLDKVSFPLSHGTERSPGTYVAPNVLGAYVGLFVGATGEGVGALGS